MILFSLLGSAVAACASVVVRFRRSTGDEREQLKWFIFAAAVIPLGLMSISQPRPSLRELSA